MITEPNTFDPSGGELLSATVKGRVDKDDVTFVKSYIGHGDAKHSVTYQGRVDKTENFISGEWTFEDTRGKFEMRRDGPTVGVKAKVTDIGLERQKEKIK